MNYFKKNSVETIYPEYYIIKVNNFDNNAKSSLDEWIYYLKNSDLPSTYRAKGLDMVSEKLKYDKMDNQAKNLYDAHQKELAVSYSMIETAKVEGRAKGRAEGKAEGESLGIVKGKIELILNAQANGFAISDISKFSGFSEKEIKEILANNID